MNREPFGHDACGVGFIARHDGRAARQIVALGLQALQRLAHRGASPALGAVDGCGVLTAIPWSFFESSIGTLPAGRTRAIAMLFVDPSDEARAVALIERELMASGALAVQWRQVPTDGAAVLPAQRHTTPLVLQAFASFDDGRIRGELTAYRTRLSIKRAAEREGVGVRVSSL